MEPRGFGLSATNSSFHKQHEHCTRRHCRGRRRQRLPASWRTFPLCARVRELTFCFIGASGLLDQKPGFLGRRVGNARRRPRHPQFGRRRRSAAQVRPEGKNCSIACVSRPAAHPWRGVSHVKNYFCDPPAGAAMIASRQSSSLGDPLAFRIFAQCSCEAGAQTGRQSATPRSAPQQPVL